jgi:hypothetical protein
MKTILKLVLATVLCVVSTVSKSEVKYKDPYHFIVEGQFLAKKNVHYTVYKQDKSGAFVSESRNKSRKYYSVTLDVGCKYIIRFQDKEGNVKFLMVDASKPGYYGINVDFTRSFDAQLRVTKVGYAVIPLTDNPIAQK